VGIFSKSKNTTIVQNTSTTEVDVGVDVNVDVAPEIVNNIGLDFAPVADSLDKLSASLASNAETSAAAVTKAAETIAEGTKAASDGVLGTVKEWGSTAAALLALIGLAVFVMRGRDVRVTL
jgi:hypothetical protein